MIQNNERIERYRLTADKASRMSIPAVLSSSESSGNNGAFIVPCPGASSMFAIVSDKAGWEHVSVSPYRAKRTPTWEEMCFIKNLFWGKEETVVQYHPAEENYVNMHEFCLHMWRPTQAIMPVPPPILVGWK